MAIINMIPSDGSVVIDGKGALGVNFTGIDPSIHAICWYGNSGQIEFVYDPLSNTKAPNEDITSLLPYQSYVNQAQAIIEAYENPQIYYATVNNVIWEGAIIPLGGEIIVTTPNTPQPPSTTTFQPPTLASYQTLFWYAGSWVASPVNPGFTLSDAQSFLVNAVKNSAANHVNTQSRIYSALQLAVSPDPGALFCADYPTVTLADYQQTLDARASALVSQIALATAVPDFYTFDPNVDPSPV